MTTEDFKRARKLLGMTGTQMARALGLSPTNGERTIERIEAGGNITGPMQHAVHRLLWLSGIDHDIPDKYKHMIQGLPRKGGEK